MSANKPLANEDNQEHIGPDTTGDNIHAKRVASYIWDGSGWTRATAASSGGATEYTDGDATTANPVGGIPVFDNAGTITAVSDTNPLPVDATVNASITFSATSAMGTNSSDEASNSSYSNWSTNTWTGTFEQNDYQHVFVNLQTDDDGGTLYFDFSQDGTNYSTFPVAGFTIAEGVNEVHTAVKSSRYFRVRYVGSGGRTYYRLQTNYTNSSLELNSPLNQSMTQDTDGAVVKSAHEVQYKPEVSSVSDGDFDTPSLTRLRELRTRDQRAIDLANCNDYTDYTIFGDDTGNLADSVDHVFGTGAITFDKLNGTANTVFAGVSANISDSAGISSVNVSEIFEDGGFVATGVKMSSIANVDYVFVRLGDDASNYNEWRWDVEELSSGEWLQLRRATSQPSTYAGNGWDTADVVWVAFGVAFNSQSNTLSGILFDNVHLVQGRVSDTTIVATVDSSLQTQKIDLNKVGGTAIDTNTGNASAGTQRVVLASDQPVVSIDDNSGSLTVDDGGSSLTVDGTVAVSGTVAVTDNSGSLTVDDGGNSLTVDGTVTANLSATDNAVLDSIDTAVNGTLTVDGSGSTQPVSGTVTANAGTGNFNVNIQDGSGTDITSTGGALDVNIASGAASGTQYTEGDTDATITGTAMMMEGAANTLYAAKGDSTDGLLVNLGANNDVSVTGTVAVTDNSGSLTVDDGGSSLTVDGTVAATQSGSWSLAANQSVNVAQMNGVATTMDNGVSGTGVQRVTIASDSTGVITARGAAAVDAAVSGNPVYTGGRASTATPTAVSADGDAQALWLTRNGALNIADAGGSITVDGTVGVSGTVTVDGSGVTQPISAASLPLPTGAATAAKQPAIGTAGTPSADVLTVQGAASMTAIKVDGSAVTQPVSGTVTANLSATDNTVLDNIDTAVSSKYITGIGHGVKTVTTAGTDVALAASTACKKVTIQAQTDNIGLIAVGGSGVDATEATGTGIILYAGDSYEFDIDNLADVYIDSTVSGEGARFTYFT